MILTGIYSFLMASVLIVLDAVDVAMTEASVGAGVSTVLLLATLHLVRGEDAKPISGALLPLLVSIGVGGALVWGTLGLPPFRTRPRRSTRTWRRATWPTRSRRPRCRTS